MKNMNPAIASEIIVSLLNEVNREGIGNLINFIRNSDYLTDAECHSHHKCKYGLMFHSLEVLDVMLSNNRVGLPSESLILVALCHDLGKACLDGRKIGRGRHPQRSLAILRQCGVQLTDMEKGAIGFHHPKTPKQYAEYVTNPLVRLLSKGDCKSTGINKIGREYSFCMLQ